MHLAIEQNALGHGEPAAARRDLLGRRQPDIPDILLETPAVLDLVAESLVVMRPVSAPSFS